MLSAGGSEGWERSIFGYTGGMMPMCAVVTGGRAGRALTDNGRSARAVKRIAQVGSMDPV